MIVAALAAELAPRARAPKAMPDMTALMDIAEPFFKQQADNTVVPLPFL